MKSLRHHTVMHQFLLEIAAGKSNHAGQDSVPYDRTEVCELVGFKGGNYVYKQMSRSREIPDGEAPDAFVSLQLVASTPVPSTDSYPQVQQGYSNSRWFFIALIPLERFPNVII